MSARRAWALCAGATIAIVAAILALPVSLPSGDDSGVPFPVLGTPAPPVAPASDPTLQPIGPLFGGQTVAQEFPANGPGLRRIGLYLSTYGRTNHGAASVIVQAYRAGAWQDLYMQSFAKETLHDNSYEFLSFSPAIPVRRGEALRIVLRVEDGSSEAITWWKSASWQPDGYALSLNGNRQDGTARFVASYAPATGRLGQKLGPIWVDLTIFLDPVWRIALLIGGTALVLGIVLVLRPLSRRTPCRHAAIVEQGGDEYTPADIEPGMERDGSQHR